MNASTQEQDISGLSFEQALRELESIVRKLEAGQIELEQAIGDYARGMHLKEHCRRKLADARMKVEQITVAGDGTIGVKPFESDRALTASL